MALRKCRNCNKSIAKGYLVEDETFYHYFCTLKCSREVHGNVLIKELQEIGNVTKCEWK